MYGEFYISEIIGRHPESQRKIIVSEVTKDIINLLQLTYIIMHLSLIIVKIDKYRQIDRASLDTVNTVVSDPN